MSFQAGSELEKKNLDLTCHYGYTCVIICNGHNVTHDAETTGEIYYFYFLMNAIIVIYA